MNTRIQYLVNELKKDRYVKQVDAVVAAEVEKRLIGRRKDSRNLAPGAVESHPTMR